MKLFITSLLIMFSAIAAAATPGQSSEKSRYALGFGAGLESGIGIQMARIYDANRYQLGLGILYNGDRAKFSYSMGLRYMRSLYTGRINNTYAWAGGGISGENEEEYTYTHSSLGLGLGVSFHFGLPFHFSLDTGLKVFSDSDEADGEFQIMPAINSAVTYEW
jgi:hypothetical protein